MKKRLASACKNLAISFASIRLRANLSGSETHANTNRNSRGACTHEDASKPFTMLGPLSSATSVKVAPRLKKPTKPPVNNENAVRKRIRVTFRRGGVQRTLPNIQGYRKESATGMQLLRKMISTTATAPWEDAARYGGNDARFDHEQEEFSKCRREGGYERPREGSKTESHKGGSKCYIDEFHGQSIKFYIIRCGSEIEWFSMYSSNRSMCCPS